MSNVTAVEQGIHGSCLIKGGNTILGYGLFMLNRLNLYECRCVCRCIDKFFQFSI